MSATSSLFPSFFVIKTVFTRFLFCFFERELVTLLLVPLEERHSNEAAIPHADRTQDLPFQE